MPGAKEAHEAQGSVVSAEHMTEVAHKDRS